MKTAIMQPYIFPYIGYYQLMSAVDVFVILDDVNFIMRGWINRNNILVNGKANLFSISLDHPSQNKLICETKLKFPQKERDSLLKTVQLAYKKAPFFNYFYPVFEEIINYENDDLTSYLHNSIEKTCHYAEIQTKILLSSKIEKNNNLKSENRIIEICKKMNTKIYINPSGGKSLYVQQNFQKENIELNFINTLFEKIRYKQFNNSFTENLSFIDILMFNSKEEIHNLLKQYTLIKA